MSNRTVLERLLVEIGEYDSNRGDRDASAGFAGRVAESIEALDGVPYSVIQKGRDWQYIIQTESYFDEEGFESELDEMIPKLKKWVSALVEAYS